MKAQQMGTLCQPPGSPFSVQDSNSAAACWWITILQRTELSVEETDGIGLFHTVTVGAGRSAQIVCNSSSTTVQKYFVMHFIFYLSYRTKVSAAHLLTAPQVKVLIDLSCSSL